MSIPLQNLKPKQLNLQEMWDIYRLWKKSEFSALDVQRILEIVFPNVDFTVYSPEDVTGMLLIGAVGSGMESFSKFIKGITNG